MFPSSFRLILASLWLSSPLTAGHAQGTAGAYEPVFDQLRHLTPLANRAAAVRNLTLRRDAIEFHLQDGSLYLATPVLGRMSRTTG